METIKKALSVVEKLYNDTDSEMPWVDMIGEALYTLKEAASMEKNFDPEENAQARYNSELETWKRGEKDD